MLESIDIRTAFRLPVDRIGSTAGRVKQPIHPYMPYVAETQDEKMFRVVRDRERWFQIVMGETWEVDEAAIDARAARIPLNSVAGECSERALKEAPSVDVERGILEWPYGYSGHRFLGDVNHTPAASTIGYGLCEIEISSIRE